jgi:hypothetical protein
MVTGLDDASPPGVRSRSWHVNPARESMPTVPDVSGTAPGRPASVTDILPRSVRPRRRHGRLLHRRGGPLATAECRDHIHANDRPHRRVGPIVNLETAGLQETRGTGVGARPGTSRSAGVRLWITRWSYAKRAPATGKTSLEPMIVATSSQVLASATRIAAFIDTPVTHTCSPWRRRR